MHAFAFDAAEYSPAAHGLHAVAPMLGPVSVIEPAAHFVQSATPDAFEYLPAAHFLHVVAPVEGPLLVIEPAGQAMQLATVAGFAAEYSPAAHAVQMFAPADGPVFVLCPAPHALQPLFPSSFWYSPARQAMQLATVAGFAAEYSPAAHAVQLLAPADGPVFVLCPVPHALQPLPPFWSWY